MKRDLMLMETILAHLQKAPESHLGTTAISQALNIDVHAVRHHLYLLLDKSLVQTMEGGAWRLSNQGHDYLEGTPIQGISLASLP